MLVLSRRENSKIVLPDLGITIQVLKISGSTAKIGIDAPREVRIVRAEIVDQSSNVPCSKSVKKNRESHIAEKKCEYRNSLSKLRIAGSSRLDLKPEKPTIIRRSAEKQKTSACTTQLPA